MRLLVPLTMLFLLSPLPAGAAPGDAPQPAPAGGIFREDARLKAPVSLAVKDRPLDEVLAALAVQLRLSLTAEHAAGDQKATLYIGSRPASEVLTRLARHLDLSWKKNGP